MTDREYINRWGSIVREYLPKWDASLPISKQSKDIESDINGFIVWLESHENKPNLRNFVYSVLPYEFIRFITKNNVKY